MITDVNSAMEARAGIEPAIGLLQSPALPLGDLAIATPPDRTGDETKRPNLPAVKRAKGALPVPIAGWKNRPKPESVLSRVPNLR